MELHYGGQEIKWTIHAADYESRRGFTKEEVESAIREADWVLNTRGRFFLLVMKISYDPKADALSIVFRDTTVTTHELETGIAGDYDSEGRLAGLEILDVAKRFGGL